VNHFIHEILPAKLDEVTTKLASKSVEDKREEIEAAKQGVLDLTKRLGKQIKTDDEVAEFCKNNPDAETVKAYLAVKEAASQAPNTEDLERDIYNDLFRFFDRYYEGGDFVTKPRAGESTYMIPYNGEETKFYWANYDQYYIKTGENFKNYVFTNGEADSRRKTTVEFRLVEVETGVNNNQNKKGRVFIPAEDYFYWDKGERKLTLNFYYKVPIKEEKDVWGDKQSVKADNKGINEKLVFTQLDSKIRETDDAFLIRLWEKEREVKNGKKPDKQKEFYYHLNRYTSINSFDYFIHKDLRTFLRQELDYFIKHEIFSLNFLADTRSDEQTQKAIQQNVIRASAIRDIAAQIIDFLAEIENFQRRLFEKKKFVVQSDYCITLDLVPTNVVAELVEFILSDPEQRQLTEWKDLGFINSIRLKAKDLAHDGYLTVDTQFLPAELKYKLLSNITDLDEKCTGLLINSENYQALNFLNSKYNNRIKCVYIDPPYNTDATPIIYKNNYRDSTWLCLIKDRVAMGASLMTDEGVMSIAIDDYELANLTKLLEQTLPNYKVQKVIVNHYPGSGTGRSNVSRTHEYNLFVVPIDADILRGNVKESGMRERNFRRSGTGENNYRIGRENSFFAVLVEPDTLEIKGIEVPPPLEEKNYETGRTSEGWIRIFPIGEDDSERVWSLSYEGAVKAWKKKLLRCTKNYVINRLYPDEKARNLLQSVWLNRKFNATTFGTNLLTDLFGSSGLFSYPKSLFTVATAIDSITFDDNQSIILDFFAGSGTTGHAVIHLNRDALDGNSNRKYILVETSEYFDTITKPRIQKIIYSAEWSKGKPIRSDEPLFEGGNKSNGASHIFQYIKLEQYEDTLNNIAFEQSGEEIAPAFEFSERIKYLLRYGTNGSPSLLATSRFARPFDYEMDIIRLNERISKKIDLVTTFNFLLGIDVVRYRTAEHQSRTYNIVEGVKSEQTYLIVWRDFDDDLDLEKERDFIKQGAWYDKDALIYSNADNAFGADSIEAEFKRLMFEDVNLD
jgi:adenine-specific DNA-methyltransferase